MTPEEIAKSLEEEEIQTTSSLSLSQEKSLKTKDNPDVLAICEEMDRIPAPEEPVLPRIAGTGRSGHRYRPIVEDTSPPIGLSGLASRVSMSTRDVSTRVPLRLPQEAPRQRFIKLLPDSGRVQFVNRAATAPRQAPTTPPPPAAPTPRPTLSAPVQKSAPLNAPRILDL